MNDNCSFNFTMDMTPTVLSISPTVGQAGTIITITGMSFYPSTVGNTVAIGDVNCSVLEANETYIRCMAGLNAAGTYGVDVRVASLGSSIGNATFEYTLNIDSLYNSTSGSIGGGTMITILGMGFPTVPERDILDVVGQYAFMQFSNESQVNNCSTTNFSVFLNDSICVVMKSNYSCITCMSGPHPAALVDVMVNVNGIISVLENTFKYSIDSTPVVTKIMPMKLPVHLSETVAIQGSGFVNIGSGAGLDSQGMLYNSTPKIDVIINGMNCETQQYSDVMINCTAPPQEPGTYPVFVLIEKVGFAVQAIALYNNKAYHLPSLLYELQVFGAFPSIGSVLGGSLLTIYGSGFSSVQSDVEVIIGELPCEVRYTNSTHIYCMTNAITKTVTVQVSVAGSTYVWDPEVLVIQVGDTVQWSWTGLTLDLFQVANGSLIYDGQGFRSERTANGNFSYTFTQPGTYYYASDLDNFVQLRGSVKVEELTSTFPISVKVRDYYAEYNITEDETTNDVSPCQGELFPEVVTFTYATCATPMVTSITPSNATVQDVITITGQGFSTIPEMNTVMIGENYTCSAINASDASFSCLLDPSALLPINQKLAIKITIVLVKISIEFEFKRSIDATPYGNGIALFNINSEDDKHIVIYPTFTNFTPITGSVQGGLDLHILGTGFDDDTIVRIGNSSCVIEFLNYSSITCTVPMLDSDMIMNEYPADIVVTTNGANAICTLSQCTFVYSKSDTPIIYDIFPRSFFGDSLSINLLFNSSLPPLPVTVTVGMYPCVVTDASNINISITCTFNPIEAGLYTVRIITPVGEAMFSSSPVVFSEAQLVSLTPTIGGAEGGNTITISGYGFSSKISNNTVLFGTQPCHIIYSNYSTVQCVAPSGSMGDNVTVAIAANNVNTPNTYYSYGESPQVTAIYPTSGQEGDNVTITGSLFFNTNIIVTIGGAVCTVHSATESEISCTLGGALAGTYPVKVMVHNIGNAAGLVTFTYILRVLAVSPMQGSFAGKNILTIHGVGFEPASTFVTICDQSCTPTNDPPSLITLQCEVPGMNYAGSDVVCNVTVFSISSNVVIANGYTYMASLTPQITSLNPTIGGTAGGTTITITGSGFTSSNTTVSIGDRINLCVISYINDTVIVCQTGAFGRTMRAEVLVNVNEEFAESGGQTFFYVDLWSSNFTWGGQPPPVEGDFVVVPRGQTLAIDVHTPILSFLLIQGGTVMFLDEGDVSLHTQFVLITDNGIMQVGTEEEPFCHKAEIVLYGHVLSTELPVYGAKTLAVRHGTLDLHGKKLNVTWTRLDVTANPGDTTIVLQEPVPWEVGGKIVIASTSYSQRENEEVEIRDIDSTRTVLTIDPPLQYEHISVKQTIAGKYIDTRAEVGYLTRNVIFRGNRITEWDAPIPECSEEFRPGQFDVQTCFQGRFGAETASDQFGGQIMLHAAVMNENRVTGRIEYVEVTHAGQAFRLGRYPIHFHLNGDVTGSYVRGCAIHHTFNRAVTVHAVNNLLVENNVAYNIMGHAYFLEDGVEIGTIIQDNLGVFVRSSSSLLNVDITPATFWVVNPNNTVRRNAAVGGSHFGFWYRLETHPTGPSFTTSVCPQNVPLGEFTDNSAHSMGWYGLWVFPAYFPKVNGACNGEIDEPAIFNNLLAWKNNRGIEFHENVGALQIHNSTMLDNIEAGVEITAITRQWDGGLVKDVLIVGHSDVNVDNLDLCTVSGFKAPHSYYLTVSNVTFVNFDRPGCSAILACSHCRNLQGGFLTRYNKITLINSPNLSGWQWTYEHVHRDLDGSLTGMINGSLLPYTGLLPSESCSVHQASSTTTINSSLCNASVDFVRIAVHSVNPSSIATRTLYLTNQYGTSTVNYELHRLTGPSGYMAIILKGHDHYIQWENADHLSNISYSLIVSGLEVDEYFWITHNYSQSVDGVVINGEQQNSSNTFPDPTVHNTGTWYSNNSNDDITYLVKGLPDGAQLGINFRTFRCFYENCIAPTPPPTLPPGVPNVTQNWSDSSTWENGRLPQEGESVFINCTQYVIIDVPIPRLANITICGGLELLDELNHTIEVDFILVDGGRLVAGWPERPFQNMAIFVLHGNKCSQEVILPPRGPILGAKAIGVFGQLILHGQNRSVIWTNLAKTAFPGSDNIEVIGTPDWNIGDVIVIASTSFEMLHTEKFQILDISQSIITLNGTLQYKHLGEETTIDEYTYIQRAEVGLLTRNIKIQSGDLAKTDEESFGCRIFVSSYTNAFGIRLVGSAQLDGVEIAYCGQEGYSDSYDPRYSFAVHSIERVGAAAGDDITYIRRSSIHDGYNTGIGVFTSDGVIISDNVIHRTVGPSVVLEGSDHKLIKTMATVALFPGTYRIDDPQNNKWTANFKLLNTKNLTLLGNAAAGGAKVGFHVDGESCDSPVINGTPRWEANVAHSTLHGIHVGYDDGLGSCLQLSYFTIYSCYHYGIFTYSRSGVYMENNILVDNNAALLLNVYSPPALSHQTSTKTVMIKDTIIVGASPYLTSEDDKVVPKVSSHSKSFSPMLAPGGGHIGMILSNFLSSIGHFPLTFWPSISSYPAISGLTTLDGVTFISFTTRYSKRDFAFVSNPISEDCQHPTYVSNAKLINVDQESMYYNHMPNLGSVNPSDCVDLDCDAQKHILIKDLDGSLLNLGAGGTIISQAEFEWDGDPRRGLGDYRIPTVLLADPNDGTPIPVDDLFPLKGIVRGGNRSEDNCTWMSSWNSYSCSGLNHLMFIFESLDEDTEVRRLSPFALAANGFIDILNGPQDHGWCGGYTCQERISTLYGIIAPGLNYEMALSSTNPQNMRFHLLNAEEIDTIRIAFVYTNPQRLDVYYGDTYVNPTNVRMENGEIVYDPKDPNLPDDQFIPTINDQAGANFYERSDKRLYFILRGNTPITIRTAPVIQLSLHLAPVTVDEFFEENLILNLATLLGIDESRIRIVNVISEASSSKRQAVGTSVDIEIGNPPPVSNATVTNQTTANSTVELNFSELEDVTIMVAEVIQTGQLSNTLNVTIISADVQPPEPPPVDPTGGVHATNTTGGPQPGEVDNDTLTYQETQDAQRTSEVTPVTLTIPTELHIISKPIGGIEGLSLTPLPILAVYDNSGNIVSNLGIGESWVVSISLMTDSANSVQVLPSSETIFIGGYANLTNFSISHPGNGYVLKFNITDPPLGFTAQTDPFDVAVRELVINIVELPDSGNTALPIYPYPTVELLDEGILERVANLGWRGRRWFARLQIQYDDGETVEWNTEFNSDNAYAIFTNVIISQSGEYLLQFSAYTNPESDIIVTEATETVIIKKLPSAIMSFVVNANFTSVIGNDEQSFIQSLISQLSQLLPEVTIYDVSLSEGSIIVTFNVQSEDTQDVQDAIDTFLDTNFTITYNSVTYDINNRTAEYVSTDSEDNDDDNTHNDAIIIASSIGGFFLLVFLITVQIVIGYQCYKKRNAKIWRIHVASCDTAHDTTKGHEMQRMYWQTTQAFIDENQYATEIFMSPDDSANKKF